MMTMQDFVIEAKHEVLAYLRRNHQEHIEVTDHEIVKANDSVMYGLVLSRNDLPGVMGGANVYLNDLFERHEAGESMDALKPDLFLRCELAARGPVPPVEQIHDLSLDTIRSRLTLRLLDVRKNRLYMAERPYIDVGSGLALIADINCDEDIRSEWKMSVTDSLMPCIGCGSEELLTAAMENTIMLEPPVLMELGEYVNSEFLGGEPPENLLLGSGSRPDPDGREWRGTEPDGFEWREAETDGFEWCETDPDEFEWRETEKARSKQDSYGMLLLTNRSLFKGAAVLFYPDVMEMVSNVIGCGYYVIPSSVHELLIVPDRMGMKADKLKAMLSSGNSTCVDSDEFLSDKVFHYSPGDERLMVAC